MTREQIVDKVLAKLEEVSPFGEGLSVLNSNSNPTESYIRSEMQPACDELLQLCPLHLTTPEPIPLTGEGLDLFIPEVVKGRSVGYLELPPDFLRLHTLKMDSWERPVHRPISIENPAYQDQFNTWARGGNAKPIVVKNSNKLEIYTFDTGSIPVIHLYVPQINMKDNFEINANLVDPLCSLIAANVYAIFGSPQQKVMLEQVNAYLKSTL